jgi:hypothetical protein
METMRLLLQYNYALLSSDVSHFDYATRWTTTMFCIHPFTNNTNFNTFSFGVKQIINAFSGGHFAFIMQFFVFRHLPI